MEILHLNLISKWYDMILSGEKKEEYRDIKPFWNKVFRHDIKIKGKYYHPTDVVICFSNGYAKDRRQFKIQCLGLKVSEGKPEWGAEPGMQYHTLILGDVQTCANRCDWPNCTLHGCMEKDPVIWAKDGPHKLVKEVLEK